MDSPPFLALPPPISRPSSPPSRAPCSLASMSHPSSGGPSTSTPTTRRSAAASQAAATEASQSAASAGPSSAPHPRSRSEAMERRSAQAASQASSTAGPSGSSSSSTFNAGGGSVASVSDCEALAARLLDPGSGTYITHTCPVTAHELASSSRRANDVLLPPRSVFAQTSRRR